MLETQQISEFLRLSVGKKPEPASEVSVDVGVVIRRLGDVSSYAVRLEFGAVRLVETDRVLAEGDTMVAAASDAVNRIVDKLGLTDDEAHRRMLCVVPDQEHDLVTVVFLVDVRTGTKGVWIPSHEVKSHLGWSSTLCKEVADWLHPTDEQDEVVADDD